MKNFLSFMLLSTATSSLFAHTRPNLLVIHTDEHNFRTLSCYQEQLGKVQGFVWGPGVNVHTPHIDRLAHEGAICNSYYCSSPVSTPSRASLITGLYPQATGAYKNGQLLRQDIPTFGSILRDQGYQTGYIGKWHLAGEETQYEMDMAYDGGFTDDRFMMNGGHAPYFEIQADGSVKLAKQFARLPKEKLIHLTDYFTDKTVDFIHAHGDEPFCLMVSIPDPHTPDIAKPPYSTMYDDMNPQPPKTMLPVHAEARPKWGYSNPSGEVKVFKEQGVRQYFGMVKHIDDSVGRMLEALEAEGVLDQTIVVFTSDHGDMYYEHHRMNKGVPYESSAKVPFVIRYPRKIKAGKVLNSAYVNTDFVPTILSLMDADWKGATFHGKDTSADFESKAKLVPAERHLAYFENNYGKWSAVSDGRHKLILSPGEKPWLIDLVKDPDELVNYYTDVNYRSVIARLEPALYDAIERYNSPHAATYLRR